MSFSFKKEKWIVGNEEDGTSLGLIALWTPAFLENFAKYSRVGPCYHIMDFTNSRLRWIVPENYSLRLAKKLLYKVVAKPSFF